MAHNWTVTRDKFLTAEEVQRLYKALRDAKDLARQRRSHYVHVRDYYMIRTLLESGVRVFELAALKVGDFRNGSLIIERGKGGKKRNIILAQATQQLIREFIKVKRQALKEPTDETAPLFASERGSAYTTRGIRKRVKYWFGKCGLNARLSCHSCRHTYVSHMLAKKIDLTTVRDNAGHASLSTTSIYAHAVKEDLGDLELYSSEFNRKQNS